jgi:hypothetical protein
MKHLLYFIFVLGFFQGYGQFGPQQIISTEAHLPVSVLAADIDGDGKLDVLTAARYDNNIAWYKNEDGQGNFGTLNLIGLLDEAKSVYASDMDGDGDMDVLATASFLDVVVWYENMDGNGSFSSQKIIDSNADGAFSVIAADIDGDGDMDVVSASDFSGLAWYENLDGNGNFSTTKIIDNTIPNSRSVVAADMDGDGDLDVVGNASTIAEIVWYENLDGLGNFGSRRDINDTGSYSNVIFVADIDGDNDMDVLSASPGDNEVAWYENLDGDGNFGSKNVITVTLEKAWTVHAADLDNDGDTDVISTLLEDFGGEVVWFENLDGNGSFSDKKVISTAVQSPRSVYAADIDNDGAMDVLSASQNDDKIAWYRNLILGVNENQVSSFKIYPNPSNGIVHIDSKKEIVRRVSVFDAMGKRIFSKQENSNEIDISNLQNGMYFLRITTDSGEFVQKIIKE